MLKALLKIFLNTLTILLVLFASLFTLARFGSLFAPNYIDSLNRQFSQQGFEFAELRVRWRGINPVVEIGQVTSEKLRIEGIITELDTLASFWHNTYVFRTIQMDRLSFVLSQDSACRIDFPNSEDGSFGIGKILRYTKNIDITFSSSIECGSSKFEHEGFLRTVRLNNVYRLHATVRELGECDHCSIALLYESKFGGFWRRSEERLLNVQAHDFLVPTGLLGLDFLKESLVNAQVLMNGTSASALLRGNIDLQPKHPPATSAGLFLNVSFALENTGGTGLIEASLLDRNQAVVGVFEHAVRQDLESDYIHGWSHEISAETVGAFMNIFGVSDHPLQQWASGLAPAGLLSTVQWIQDQAGITYWIAADELGIQRYANIPSLVLDSVVVSGRGTLVHAEATAQKLNIDEAQFLSAPLSLKSIDCSSVAMWREGYFGWSIYGDWVPTSEASAIDFNIVFGKSFPTQRQWFRFALGTPVVSTEQMRPYLASFLPTEAFNWVERSVERGKFGEASLQFVQSRDVLNQNLTTLEIHSQLADVEVIFNEDWPGIERGTGRFWFTQDALTIEVDSAYSHGNHIEQGTIVLPLSDPWIDVDFTADMTFLLLQSYLVESPLGDLLPFDPLDFDGSGAIDLETALRIPLSEENQNLWEVELNLVLSDVFLDIVTANIQLDDMYGNVGYQFPNELTSSQLSAKFQDDPVSLELSTQEGASDSEEAVFAFDLNTSVGAIASLTGDWVHTIASGTAQVYGEIIFPIGSDLPPTINISTDLVGVAFTLPEPFQKEADQNRPMELQITLGDPMMVDVTMDEVRVRTILADDAPLRGSIGFNVPPTQLTSATRDWVVAGRVEELVFAMDQDSDATLPTDIDIEFVDFHIQKLVRGRFQLHDLILDGTFGGDDSALLVAAEEGSASLSRDQGHNWQLSVDRLRLWHSAFETPTDQPMDPAIFLQLPRIDVSIQELYMFAENGDAEEFGAWYFELDTTDHEVHLRNIVADIRGVRLDTQENFGVVWDTEKNETRFDGVISGGNLLQVLPKFNVEAEIESENFTVHSDLTWPGSPFDVDTLKMNGRIHGDANEGTLLEVDAGQGILRLLSMFNIAPIIQRMDFDPSAMFSKGYGFDRILFDVSLDKSQVIIQEPIHIKGRSSEVLFTGNANLADESLTMDVVVRLPFSTNLKWYVALITGNPTAFLGTMIGSRIFRPQLNRISSAKYRVEGSFETPEVELIGVFNDDLSGEPAEDVPIIEE